MMVERNLRTPHIPLSAEIDLLHACYARGGQEVRLRSAQRANRACRLRKSSCSRLVSGETVAQTAGRDAHGPY